MRFPFLWGLRIHALRTNEALPVRHGISDFLKAPAAVQPARCNCYAEAGPCAECPVPTMALSEAAKPLSTHSRLQLARGTPQFYEFTPYSPRGVTIPARRAAIQ